MRISRLLVGVGIAVTLPTALHLRPRRVEVRGESMLPGLEPGDHLVVVRGVVRPGDIVAVRDPRAPQREMVKRAAAVDEGGVTVLGDNPAASTDSRHFGPVPAALVTGVAVYRYHPPSRAGWLRGRRVRSAEWTTPASTPSWRPTTSTD